jgi:hypothetical protein
MGAIQWILVQLALDLEVRVLLKEVANERVAKASGDLVLG